MHFFHILTNQGILFTGAYPAADAQFFSLVKLNETSGVVLANVCIRMRKNTPELPVAQNFNYPPGMALCCGTDIQPKQRELRVFLQLGTIQT